MIEFVFSIIILNVIFIIKIYIILIEVYEFRIKSCWMGFVENFCLYIILYIYKFSWCWINNLFILNKFKILE